MNVDRVAADERSSDPFHAPDGDCRHNSTEPGDGVQDAVSTATDPTHHLQTTIGAPGVLRAVMGGGLYLDVLGLLAFGIGAIILSATSCLLFSYFPA